MIVAPRDTDLDQCWAEAWVALGRPAPRDLFIELRVRYAEPQRRYHTLEHIRECLQRAAETRALQAQPAEIDLAIWFHDAIYEPRRADNEERSADWAASALRSAGVAPGSIERVRDWILLTKHDSVPADSDARIFVDIDLSILGAPPARFAAYESAIREEYAWVPEDTFRARRAEVLQRFLARDCIFATGWFRERFEAQARENLKQSLQQLTAPQVPRAVQN